MRTAIVTGGSSGIGRSICELLGARNYKVFVTGRNEANMAAVVEEVKKRGGEAAYGSGDVSSEADVGRLYEEATAYLGTEAPDVVVANAGVGRFGALEGVSAADYDLSFNTNVRGVFLWLRAVIPAMKAAKKGQLVVMSSVAGIRCYATGPVYCATKWALQGLCGSVRMDLKGTGVKLGTVNPGGVATPWWTEADRGGKPTPATQEKLDSLLSPEDVAQATMTLVDQSSTSNIEMISLDPPE
eukprot:gene5485-26295_t